MHADSSTASLSEFRSSASSIDSMLGFMGKLEWLNTELIETCGREEILSVYTALVVKAKENIPFETGLCEGAVKGII
jgi:hypothetical protein